MPNMHKLLSQALKIGIFNRYMNELSLLTGIFIEEQICVNTDSVRFLPLSVKKNLLSLFIRRQFAFVQEASLAQELLGAECEKNFSSARNS